MGLPIGLDFGTTNSTIAFFDEADQLKLFQINPAHPTYYIPSKVFRPTKSPDMSIIGADAKRYHEKNLDGTAGEFYEYFKMFLPLQETDQLSNHWTGAWSPFEAASMYLTKLLNEFEKQHGAVRSIVCSVPELWQRELTNHGAKQMEALMRNHLHLELDQLISEPVAVAAYYAYQRQKEGRPFTGNLLVCDMGGGTFDVALCNIGEQRIEVLSFEGFGDHDLHAAGVSFDNRVIDEILKHSGEEASGFVRQQMAWKFEEEKLIEANNEVLHQALQHFETESMEPYLDNGVYDFIFSSRRYEVSFRQLFQAFAPIQAGIEASLDNIVHWMRTNDQAIDQVAIVGGFGQYPLVRKTILDKLNLHDRFDSAFHRLAMVYSIAAGTAVIASRKYQVIEKFPHTLGITARKISDGAIQDGDFELLTAGDYTLGKHISWLTKRDGDRMEVRIARDAVPIPFWIKRNGKAEDKLELNIRVHAPAVGYYYIGAIVSPNYQASIIFEEKVTGIMHPISLGDLSISKLVHEVSL